MRFGINPYHCSFIRAYLIVMTIPDLPPELTFEILGASQEDCDFAFKAKRRAMGPHVEKMWGWDESYQRVVHERHYAEKPFYAIKMSSENIGTLSFQVLSQYVRFGEFYIFRSIKGRALDRRYFPISWHWPIAWGYLPGWNIFIGAQSGAFTEGMDFRTSVVQIYTCSWSGSRF